MTSYRLPQGGRIDRAKRVGFRFDGAAFSGFAGDTLASALLGNGVSLMGRSFKYHRPRGVVTAGSAEPNALVTVGEGGRREPNARATMVELHEGLVAESQNRWPSLRFDVGAVNGLLSPFLSAGFYYKTFMWPAALWEKLYEPAIRRAAGLGRAGVAPDPDLYEKVWAHCDLLIVGAGPAGQAAALTSARAGLDTILVDEDFALKDAGALAELQSLPNLRLMTRTTAVAWYDDMVFAAVERVQKHVALPDPHEPVERLWRIAAKRALLCTGAEERPIVFAGNDRPGVMLAGAGATYAQRFGVAVGRRVALFTNTGASRARGVEVAEVIDARKGGLVVSTTGGLAITGAEIEQDGQRRRVECDALLMSGGFSPRIHLACQRGGRPRWSEAHQAFLAPEGGLPLAGAAAGVYGDAAALRDGARKAAEIAAELGRAAAPAEFPVSEEAEESVAKPLWRVPGNGKAFVDFQNDVKADDLGLAVREGYDHVELAKRYTTNGMATDQGKLSNVNAIGLLAQARGVSPAEVGTTTFRPFYTPVSFGALAGAHKGHEFQPTRRSPLEAWANRRGAVFIEAGPWMRSSYFPQPGETHWRQTVDREAKAVRAGVGMADVSTLGKIELVGPDAGVFLDRLYTNPFAKLPVGRARYGLMLREDGFVFDDGTTSRLDENRYFMTTTTAAAAQVLEHMEYCAQVVWPELKVRFASVTDQWAQMAVAGPLSRATLQSLVDADISNEAFPHLSAREVTVLGGRIPARLFRLSYSGELAYELSVPAGFGDRVAEAVMQAGATHDICPYGLEAMGVMRIEKGHVTHAEINGTTTPEDLGLGKLVSEKKADFIGRAMLTREGLRRADRPRLVGLISLDPAKALRPGAHILRKGDAAKLENDQGHVTSACWSPHLESPIALALAQRGAQRMDEEVIAWSALTNEFTPARIVAPGFVDPSNGRLHV
jgi:sarcosine oxidase subunit alpha